MPEAVIGRDVSDHLLPGDGEDKAIIVGDGELQSQYVTSS